MAPAAPDATVNAGVIANGNVTVHGGIHIGATAAELIAFAQKLAEATAAQAVAEGFICEMAQRVAADQTLDLEGMRQAVRTAIDIYEKEIAGGVQQSNTDDIVTRALQQARKQYDEGKSRLAQETLRRAMEEMRQEEQDRRDRFEQGVKTLGERRRDMALAAYDGEAAAQAVIEMAEALHADHQSRWEELNQEQDALTAFGRDHGSNVHLVAAIGVISHLERIARTPDEKGFAHNEHGIAAVTLGDRESGTVHLEEAVDAFRAALEEFSRERVPLNWATTQNNLGNALGTFGRRESGTARLEQAVDAYRAALEEGTRERVPLQWAGTQNNLGEALRLLGARESGTDRLEQAVDAYYATLKEWTRERVPLDWAMTQNNLGNALATLGERESGTSRWEAAVAVFRAALEERTRERVPLDWAATQNNLGAALGRLGEQEEGTTRLEEAVAVFRAALEERTRERVPLDWAATQNNLGAALHALGDRESGTALLEQAVTAYSAALEECKRERVPLDWASTIGNQSSAMLTLAERTTDAALASRALAQLETAERVLREGGHEAWSEIHRNQIPKAKALIARLTAAPRAETPPQKPGVLQKFFSG